MKKSNVTIAMPPEWVELLKRKSDSKACYLAHYIREIIRADLNLPPSITSFDRSLRRDIRKASKTSTHIQLKLPRKSQDIILGMASKTGWSISSIVQRIIEVDLAPMPSKAVISKINQNNLAREHSDAGKALGAEYWVEYYQENPKSPTYKLEVSIPLGWQDALQAKADLNATTTYLLVRTALMKRFFGRDYLTADTDAA